MLALVAVMRTSARGELARRIAFLENEIERLRAALGERGPATTAAADLVPERAPGEAMAAAHEAGAPAYEASTADDDASTSGYEAGTAGHGASTPMYEPRASAHEASAIVDEAQPGAGEVDAAADAPGGPEPPSPPAPPGGLLPAGIDWEQWLGVRGAAVLGGIVLALAGLFFFRYSVEHGLFPPWLRVVLGALTGVAALAGAEWMLRTRYAGTANALAGGGLVVLYAAFWAAGTLYGLIGPGAVFALMAVVTVAGCVLSLRHESLVIAVLGLVGGFATPLFASSGADRPIGLFGYILLLDVGLLAIARRKRWPVLALLSLGGTALYQALWIVGRMGAERTLLGVVVLALFAMVFAVVAPRLGAERTAQWRWSQRGAILLPFAFAIYFAGNVWLETSIAELGGLLIVLGLAAGWLARKHGDGRFALDAGAATVAVLLVWSGQHPDLGGAAWTASGLLVLVALAYHAPLELGARHGRETRPGGPQDTGQETQPVDATSATSAGRGSAAAALANAATVVALGLLLILVYAGADGDFSLWPMLAGWLGIAAVLVRQATFPGRAPVQAAAALGVGLGLAAYRLGHLGEPPVPAPAVAGAATVLATMLAVAVAWQGLAFALALARSPSRLWAERAAAALALLLLLARLPDPSGDAVPGLGLPLALGFLALLAATRLGGGPWMVACVLATAFVQLGWTMDHHPGPTLLGLGLAGLSSVLFATWPLAAARWLREDAWTWRSAALAGPAWLPALLVLFEDRLGDAAIGLLPLGLGAVGVAVAARTRELWPVGDARRTSALAWLCGGALGLVTVAVPLQLEKEWITIGWALEGVALLLLWTRLDHAGLKYTALALLGAVAVRLILNDAVTSYYPRPTWRIVNWLAYTYLVPAAALVFAAKILRPLEPARLRPWERRWYTRELPIGAAATGLAALLVIFAWLNLAIAEWFSSGDSIHVAFDRMPARDLTTSIVWALYAVALLVLGVRLRISGLRWVSLGLLLVTIAKIFLFDLGELRDLYRVAALLGLAVSLIVVSLVYQRFVFRGSTTEGGT